MNFVTQNSFPFRHRFVRPGKFYRCESEEKLRGLRRRAALRSQLGVTGSGPQESLDSVLATLIREGDAFEKWREGHDCLQNLQVVQRTRGIATSIASLHFEKQQSFHIAIQRTTDSQLEVWECGDDMELRFPVFRLPLSSIERRRQTTIEERLRPDVLLTFDIKHDWDGTTAGLRTNALASKRDDPARDLTSFFRQARETFSIALAILSAARKFLKPAFDAIIGFRATEFYPWQYQDIRNDRLYQLGDMFRPAMRMH